MTAMTLKEVLLLVMRFLFCFSHNNNNKNNNNKNINTYSGKYMQCDNQKVKFKTDLKS